METGQSYQEMLFVAGRGYLCSLGKALMDTEESYWNMLFVFCRQGPDGDGGELPGDGRHQVLAGRQREAELHRATASPADKRSQGS